MMSISRVVYTKSIPYRLDGYTLNLVKKCNNIAKYVKLVGVDYSAKIRTTYF